MKTKEKLIVLAKQYVKNAHVIGLVNALEGGVIYLEELLIEFFIRTVKFDINDFKAIPDGKPFMLGYAPNTPEGIFMSDSGGDLAWVAVKGYANDWCIYIHWINSSIDYIISNGDKVTHEDNILKCVNCTKEVLDLYRY